MAALKLTPCKDKETAIKKYIKLAKADKGVYLVFVRKGKAFIAKLPSDTYYVAVADHRKNPTEIGKA